jgi:hypothetical protein
MVEWWIFGPETLAAVCKPRQRNSQFEQAENQGIYSSKSTNFSESQSKKFKHYFGYCKQVYCMCGLQENCVFNECHISLHPT